MRGIRRTSAAALVAAALRHRGSWFAAVAVLTFGAIAGTPGADPASLLPGVDGVSAAAAPSQHADPERGTPSLASLKATAAQGTPAGSGPSANVGQTITLKGAALAAGTAVFSGYNPSQPPSATLTDIKVGKKGKAVVPPMAVTGPVFVRPTGGGDSASLNLQIVPTLRTLSTNILTPGATINIAGSGFDTGARVAFPGVATPVVPSSLDDDTATVTVPTGTQKGRLKVTTAGGTSNEIKVKLAPAALALANRSLATDPKTGYILATDDERNVVSVIDPASGRTLHEVAVGDEPNAIWIDPAKRIAQIGHADEKTFVRIDLDTWDVRDINGFIQTGFTIWRAYVTGDRIDLSSFKNGVVSEWSLQVGPGLEDVLLTRDDSRAVVLAGDWGLLYVVDLKTRTIVATHRFDGPIEGVTIGLDGRAYTIDRATGTLLSVPIE